MPIVDIYFSHVNPFWTLSAKAEVNESLSRAGLTYDKGVKVRHFARVLYEEVGMDELKRHFTKSLEGLRIATHYGCHYLKPSEIYDNFDQVEDTHTLDDMVALTGATVVDYANKKRCCGGPVLPVDEKMSLAVAKEKLDDILEAGANAINLVCPFCSVMYDSNQKGIETAFAASSITVSGSPGDEREGLQGERARMTHGLAMGFSPLLFLAHLICLGDGRPQTMIFLNGR